jgi:hypothetical protein
LSGALFVKNPRRRRTARKARRGRTAFRLFGGLFKNRRKSRRSSGGMKMRHNRRRAGKTGVLARLLKRFKMKRNAGYMLNRRRRRSLNPMKSFRAHGKAVSFFAKKNRSRRRKNAGYMLNRRHRKNAGYQLNRRRHGVKRNPSEGGGFSLPILRPVQNLLSKVPFLGHPVAKALGYIAFGAAAGATHYYGVKAIRYVGGMLPAPVQAFARSYLAPVGYSLTGVAANFALQKLPIPFLSDDQKRKLGIAAMIAGGVLDVFRALKGQSSDLGDMDDYGDGGAYDVVPLGGIGESMGAIGQGFGAIGQGFGAYADAEMADAYYSGPDLDSYEGQAAMHGAHAYHATFGPPPKVTSRAASPMSRHAGRRGHRWGWLVKAVGFDRFGRIAAMEPEARCALIAELRKNAMATVDTRVGTSSSMGAIGQGMGAIGQSFAGIGQGFGAIGQGFGQVASEGMGDLGFMSAGSAY